MRLDPEFAKVVNSLVIAAREASANEHFNDRTVAENLRYLRARKMRSEMAGKIGHEQQSGVVGAGAEGATRILSSLQVIIDGMTSRAERRQRLNEGGHPTGDGTLVELVGRGLAELFFDPDGQPAWVPSIRLLVAVVEDTAGWLGARETIEPGELRIDDDL